MRTVFGVSASPFVRKVRVVLAEKGLPYELDPVFPGVGGPPDWAAISPLGKIPALRDGAHTLADSSVICAYLERVAPEPRLYPADPYEYARALWFEEYGDGGLMPVFGPKVFFERIVGPRFRNHRTDEAVVEKAITTEIPPLCAYLESQLTGDYFVGRSLTIADIGLATQFVNLRYAGVAVDAGRFPKLARWLARVLERPSFDVLIHGERAEFGFDW